MSASLALIQHRTPMTTTTVPLIEVRGLKKYFGQSERPVRAVDDV